MTIEAHISVDKLTFCHPLSSTVTDLRPLTMNIKIDLIFSILMFIGSCSLRPQKNMKSEIDNVVMSVSSIGRSSRSLTAQEVSDPISSSGSEQRLRVLRQTGPLMPYRYGYAVQDDLGNDFNQQEQSNGGEVEHSYVVDHIKDDLLSA